MRRPRFSLARAIVLSVAIVALGWAWWLFAPSQLGGDATYVMTRGISMEPLFHTGDLAIVKPAPSYHVGEIVAYHAPIVGVTLHRIIADHNGHFTMKGDNNDFTDPFHPTARQVVGRLWLHIPKLGVIIPFVHQPIVVAIVVGLLAMLLFGLGASPRVRRARRRRRPNREHAGPPSPKGAIGGGGEDPNRTGSDRRKEGTQVRTSSNQPTGPGSASGPGRKVPTATVLGPVGQSVATIAAVVALVSLGVGAMAFLTPTRYATVRPVPYTEQGTFSYQAPAYGSVYASGSVHTGEPVFLRLSSLVYMSFTDQLVTKAPAILQGTESMNAVVSRSDGWHTTIPLVAKRPVSGTSVSMTGLLSIPSVEAAINSFLAATQPISTATPGQPAPAPATFATSGGSYNVVVTANVSLAGTLGKVAFSRTFDPQLAFQLSPSELQMASAGSGSSAGTAASGSGPSAGSAGQVSTANPADSSLAGSVSVPAVATRDLRLPFVHPSVPMARKGALAGLVAAILIGLIVYALARLAMRRDEPARIRTRYGPLIVSVTGKSSLATSEHLVTVDSIEDLVKVADGEGRMVLHEVRGGADDYYVQTEDIIYHYQAMRDGSASASVPAGVGGALASAVAGSSEAGGASEPGAAAGTGSEAVLDPVASQNGSSVTSDVD